MCGRYGRWSRRQRIEELLGIESSGLDDFTSLYNFTPGVDTSIARVQDGRPCLDSDRRCLVPYWSNDPKKGARPVNARAETAHKKPLFKTLTRERRCLIPANRYFEWKETPVGRRPYCIRMEDEAPFCRGGMWDVWHATGPDAFFTFTVLTTFPNEVSGTVHDRIPVIVHAKDYRHWFDPESEDVALLSPYLAQGVVTYPVSPRVNSPRSDDAGLIEPEPCDPR